MDMLSSNGSSWRWSPFSHSPRKPAYSLWWVGLLFRPHRSGITKQTLNTSKVLWIGQTLKTSGWMAREIYGTSRFHSQGFLSMCFDYRPHTERQKWVDQEQNIKSLFWKYDMVRKITQPSQYKRLDCSYFWQSWQSINNLTQVSL